MTLIIHRMILLVINGIIDDLTNVGSFRSKSMPAVPGELGGIVGCS